MKLACGIVAALVAVGGAAWWWSQAEPAQGPRWRTAAVARGTVVETVNTTGTLQAMRTVEIGTQVSGIIKELLVDWNDVVRRGDVLARLEPDVLAARLAQEEASLVAAEASVERARVLVEEARARERRMAGLVQQTLARTEELETAVFATRAAAASLRAEETRVVQARAAVQMARTNLGFATITSPIDGVVLTRQVDIGQTVAASLQAPVLFTLAEDLRMMRVEANVDEADIGRIHTGLAVGFTVDAYPGRRFRGVVTQRRLGPEVVQNVVTYRVIIDTRNPDQTLLPGMTANVEVEAARADDVLVVPTAALRFQPPATGADAAAGGGPAGGGGAAAPARAGGRPEGGAGAPGERPAGAGARSEGAGPGSGGPAAGAGGRRRREASGKGRVWVLEGDGAPRAVEVDVGPSDGMRTAVSSPDLKEGVVVVIGLEQGATGGGGPVNPMSLLRGRR